MWRQGDVLIQRVDSIPPNLSPRRRLILASGDSTAHRHQIKERGVAQLFAAPDGTLYLLVAGPEATVVHPEHGPITLATGNYRVWKQREFDDEKPRPVLD